jgi:hypothetical protein
MVKNITTQINSFATVPDRFEVADNNLSPLVLTFWPYWMIPRSVLPVHAPGVIKACSPLGVSTDKLQSDQRSYSRQLGTRPA